MHFLAFLAHSFPKYKTCAFAIQPPTTENVQKYFRFCSKKYEMLFCWFGLQIYSVSNVPCHLYFLPRSGLALSCVFFQAAGPFFMRLNMCLFPCVLSMRLTMCFANSIPLPCGPCGLFSSSFFFLSVDICLFPMVVV